MRVYAYPDLHYSKNIYFNPSQARIPKAPTIIALPNKVPAVIVSMPLRKSASAANTRATLRRFPTVMSTGPQIPNRIYSTERNVGRIRISNTAQQWNAQGLTYQRAGVIYQVHDSRQSNEQPRSWIGGKFEWWSQFQCIGEVDGNPQDEQGGESHKPGKEIFVQAKRESVG